MNWTWPAAHSLIAFAAISLIYLIYHYALQAPQWRARWAQTRSEDALEAASVYAQRVLGGLWLGGTALAAGWALGLSPAVIGLGAGDVPRSALWVLGGAALLLPLIVRAASRPAHWALYPQMRVGHWPRRRQALNALAWMVYLLGYEILFRGLCLQYLVVQFGPWPGIFFSSALYAYAHLHKDAAETFGSVLMGVVFALMTLDTGAIWAAFLLHALIAIGGEQTAILRNPALRHDAG